MQPPGLEQLSAAWSEAEAERAFWRDHYQEYVERHPDQFVAVSGGTVAATSPDLEGLLSALRDKGLDPQQVWVRYVTADPRRLMR